MATKTRAASLIFYLKVVFLPGVRPEEAGGDAVGDWEEAQTGVKTARPAQQPSIAVHQAAGTGAAKPTSNTILSSCAASIF